MTSRSRGYLIIQINIDFVTLIHRAVEISDLKMTVRMRCQGTTITGVGTMGKSVLTNNVRTTLFNKKREKNYRQKVKKASQALGYTFPH